MPNNLTVLPNKKEKAEQEKKIVTEIKPKLEKFLIDQQVNKASDTAHKNYEQAIETIEEMTRAQADVQASRVAMQAFLDLKLWEHYRPPLEYAWLTGVRSSDGKKLTLQEIKSELAHDISGFSTYLITEWKNMKKDVAAGKYPDPMSTKEENITFFWQKFCNDMNILVKSDQRYQALGNKGLLLPD